MTDDTLFPFDLPSVWRKTLGLLQTEPPGLPQTKLTPSAGTEALGLELDEIKTSKQLDKAENESDEGRR
jgi:hypothetical protein